MFVIRAVDASEEGRALVNYLFHGVLPLVQVLCENIDASLPSHNLAAQFNDFAQKLMVSYFDIILM